MVELLAWFGPNFKGLINIRILKPPPPPPPISTKSGFKLVCNVNIVYGNLKSENSQDYVQKPQQNCTFMNSATGVNGELGVHFGNAQWQKNVGAYMLCTLPIKINQHQWIKSVCCLKNMLWFHLTNSKFCCIWWKSRIIMHLIWSSVENSDTKGHSTFSKCT